MNTSAPIDATILIATDNATDAAQVENLLCQEFDHIFTSTNPDMAVQDFERHRPDVLVLAFNELEKAERYYLELHRQCQAIHQCHHRTVILCNKDEVKQVYALCMKDYFDDYILFWPMAEDSSRLSMTIHHALRELAALKSGVPPVAGLPSQPRHLAKLENILDQQMAQDFSQGGAHHLETDHALDMKGGTVRPVVLVVDDDEFQRKMISKILESENYHLIFANDGFEALGILRRTRPDIILMDVMMPNMDGIATTRRIKSIHQFADTPVIMITGKSEGKVVIDSMKAGAIDFMVKPFDRATLISKLARAWATRSSALPKNCGA